LHHEAENEAENILNHTQANFYNTKKGAGKNSPFFALSIISFPFLSSGKHDKKMNLIAVLDGFDEFIGVSRRMIHKNLNDV